MYHWTDKQLPLTLYQDSSNKENALLPPPQTVTKKNSNVYV